MTLAEVITMMTSCLTFLLVYMTSVQCQDYIDVGVGSGGDEDGLIFTGGSTVFPDAGGCSGNPCHNGGQCFEDEGAIYLCGCNPGFTGSLCQTEINECVSGPCVNGGTCADGPNSYFCTCPSEFTGTRCEKSVVVYMADIKNALDSVDLHTGNASVAEVTSMLTNIVSGLNVGPILDDTQAQNTSGANGSDTSATDERIQARAQVVDLISTLSQQEGPASIADITTMTSVLTSVTSVTAELSEETMKSSINALDNLIGKVGLGSGSVTKEDTEAVSTAALSTAGNLVGAVLGSPSSPQDPGVEQGGQGGGISREVVTQVDRFVSSLGDTLLQVLAEGDTMAVDSPTVSIRVSKVVPVPGQTAQVQTSFGNLELPADLTENQKPLQIKAVAYEGNMYSYGSGAENINSPMLKLDIKDENGDVISYAQSPLSLAITTGSADNVTNPEVDAANCTVENGMIHKYTISSSGSALLFSFTRGTPSSSYDVIGKVFQRPTNDDNDFRFTISESLEVTSETLKLNRKYDGMTLDLFLSASAMKVVTEVDVYIEVRCLGAEDDTPLASRRKRYATGASPPSPGGNATDEAGAPTPGGNASYGAGATVFLPKYWDSETQSWKTSDSLEVDPTTSRGEIKFKSNFMGSFCSGIFTPPNTIDFSNVLSNFSELLAENYAVLVLICCLIGAYVPLVILARRADLKDQIRWDYAPLVDNRPTDSYYYLVSVYTGSALGGGTSQLVYLIAEGSNYVSPIRVLTDVTGKRMERGSLSNFLLSTPVDLGQIENIIVWHDGKDSSWYLEKILITDVQKQASYTFVGNCWLSETKGDGRIFKKLEPLDEDTSKSFDFLFPAHVKQSLFDSHVWFSVARRPDASRYSRVQRLSTCLSLLFLSMVSSAMWFGTEPDNSPGLQLGPVYISFHTLYVSVISSVVIIPPTIVIMQIFRRTRRRKKSAKVTEKVTEEVTSKPSITSRFADLLAEDNRTKRQKMFTVEQEFKFISLILDADATNHDLEDVLESQHEVDIPHASPARKCGFPWWFTVVGYFLVFAGVFLGGFFTLFYSLDWGKEKSHQWLLSIFLASSQNILILSPIKIFLLSLLLACIMRKPESSGSEDFSWTEARRRNKESTSYSNTDLNSFPLPSFIPGKFDLDGNEAGSTKTTCRLHRKQDVKMYSLLREFSLQLCTVLLILVLCYANRDAMTFTQNDTIKTNLDVGKITSLESVWPWLSDVMVPYLLPSLSPSETPLNPYSALFTQGQACYRLSAIRIRQLRSNREPCNTRKIGEIIDSKRPRYSSKTAETRNFTTGWKSVVGNTTGKQLTPYWYMTDRSKFSTRIYGKFGTYPPGGYMVTLSASASQARIQISALRSQLWLDTRTAAVTMETSLYNANLNLLTSVRVLAEVPVTSGVYAQAQVHSFRPYPYVDAWDFLFLLIQITWGCYVIFLSVRAGNRIRKEGRKYFRQPWNVLDCVIVTLSLLAMTFFILRSVTIVRCVEQIMNNKGTYVAVDMVRIWDDGYSYTMAICLFAATLTLFRPMIFSSTLAQLSAVLSSSAWPLAEFSTIFLVFLLAFGSSVVIGLGSMYEEFCAISSALATEFAMSLVGFKELNSGNTDDFTFSRTVLISFHICSQVVFMNIFVSFIYLQLSTIRNDKRLTRKNKELSQHMWSKIAGLLMKKGSKK